MWGMRRRGRILLGLVAVSLLLVGTLLALADGYWVVPRAAPRPRAAQTPAEELPVADPPSEPATAGSVAGSSWTIVGTVTDRDKSPIAGARVLVDLAGADPARETGEARTDDAGHYEATLLLPRAGAPVNLYAQVEAEGFAPGWAPLSIHPGATTRRSVCNVMLQKGAMISGRVVDPAGHPVAGAVVRLVQAGSFGTAGMWLTDRAGRFVLEARAGSHGIFAYAEGYALGKAGPFDLSGADGKDVGDIVLPEGLVLEGHVRYADGTPVAGAQLEVTRPRTPLRASVGTAADGSFRLTGLDEGACRIWLNGWMESGGFAGSGAPERTCNAGDRDVVLTVPGGRVRVRLVGENGDAVPGRCLFFVDEPHDRNMFPVTDPGQGGEISYFAPRGTLCLIAAEGRGRVPAEQQLRIPSDRNETEVVLKLLPPAPEGRLRIELTAPSGTPLRARVYTRLTNRFVLLLAHDGSGSPVFDMPAGRFRLELQPGDDIPSFFEPVPVPVEVEKGRESVVQVETPACGRVRLEVRADEQLMAGYKGNLIRQEDGAEIPLKEFAERLGAPWTHALCARKPAIARPLLRPGLYRARITLTGHEPFEEIIRVDALAITDVVAEMVRTKG